MKKKKQVVVKTVLGEKQLVVSGSDLLGHTKKVRNKVENLEINPEDHEDGDVVAEIEVDIDGSTN